MKESLKNKIDKYIKKLRDKQPDCYNKFLLLDYLTSDEVDVMMSISNRTDGKTYAHVKTLTTLNKEFDIKPLYVCRHFTVRKALLSSITSILCDEDIYNMSDVSILNREDYIELVNKKGKTICAITDLNSAGDLKYRSLELRKYDLIVYDEFIALEHEYLSYEVEALQVIYQSMDRDCPSRIFENQKILMLGNAMNFASPLISYFHLFPDLESAKMNEVKIVDKLTNNNSYLKIAIELRRNESANKKKNNKIFAMGEVDYATSGEFKTNNYLIYKYNNTPNENITIKYDDKYIRCYYTSTQIILDVLSYSEHYQYCNKISDIKENVYYLNKKYYDEKHEKNMYNKNIFYLNTYSLNYISEKQELSYLKYTSIIEDVMYKPTQLELSRNLKNRKERELSLLASFHE